MSYKSQVSSIPSETVNTTRHFEAFQALRVIRLYRWRISMKDYLFSFFMFQETTMHFKHSMKFLLNYNIKTHAKME